MAFHPSESMSSIEDVNNTAAFSPQSVIEISPAATEEIPQGSAFWQFRLSAHELFSLFTATIIRKNVIFTR
ncbi:hypothetical protein [Flavihumibacter petaseus]|uniref:hypothetical protein n=1 Tax=Flavihumibacter petaseus TaxID=549295 RepID=UPI00061CE7FD|nr:hypothetical protein [Flavihumibacter petaseus]